MPAVRIALLSLALFTLHSSLFTSAAWAHPVPRSEYDRNLTVEWKSDGIHVLYRLEIDQYTLLTTVGNPANGFPLDPKKRVGPQSVADAYIARMREVIPDGLQGTLDGKPITFTCTEAKVDFTDSAQFRFRLKAAGPINPGRHTVEVEDLNFLDKSGRLAMKFDAGRWVTIEKVSEPPDGRVNETTESERRTLSATVVLPGTLPPSPTIEETPRTEATPEPQPAGFCDLFRN